MAKSRGKYRKALEGKPIHLGTDESYQSRVNTEKDRIREMLTAGGSTLSSSRLARLVSKQRLKISGIEAVLSDANLSLEAANQLLVEQYEADDITSQSLGDGGSVRVQPEPYTQVEDKAKVRQWALDNGLGELLSLPWQTLNGITKERLLAGQPEPDGTSVWIKNKVVVHQGDPDQDGE